MTKPWDTVPPLLFINNIRDCNKIIIIGGRVDKRSGVFGQKVGGIRSKGRGFDPGDKGSQL